MNIDRIEVFNRIKRYNSNITIKESTLICTMFERLVVQKDIEIADISTEDEWIESTYTAKFSAKLVTDLAENHGIDVDDEIANALIYEIVNEIGNEFPHGSKLGYLKLHRCISADLYTIEVSFGGLL